MAEGTKKSRSGAQLQEWAELVLPYLPPPDLASISTTCKSLHNLSLSITSRRSSDASRSLENHHHPIPFLNSVDSHPYSYFLYSPFPLLLSSLPFSQPWGGPSNTPISPLSSLAAFFSSTALTGFGCQCQDCSSDSDLCPCSSNPRSSDLLTGSEAGGMGAVAECGTNCRCGSDCVNRSTQRGVGVRLKIVRHLNRGWGLHADQFIERGGFVCEYAGEFLSTEEARKRQRMYDELASSGRLCPALLVVREHLPSGKACLRVNIDATKVGNVARFINHSCDGGNLLPVLVRNSGSLLPRLCFFAASDILEDEELTFSYGEARLRPNGLPCFCGSEVCCGVLPSEDT